MADSAELRIVSVGDENAPMVGSVPAANPPQVPPINQPQPTAPSPRESPASKNLPWATVVEPPTDKLVESLLGLRGVIGGIFGPLSGAALDVVAAFRKLSTESTKLPDVFNRPIGPLKWTPPPSPPQSPYPAHYGNRHRGDRSGVEPPEVIIPPVHRPFAPAAPAPSAGIKILSPAERDTKGASPEPVSSFTAAPRQVPRPGPQFQPGPSSPPPAQRAAVSEAPLRQPATFPDIKPAEIVPPKPNVKNIYGQIGEHLEKNAAKIALNFAVGQATHAAVRGAGDLAASAISPNTDIAAPIAKFGSAISQASNAVLLVNPMLGIMGKAVGAATESFAGLIEVVDGLADRYGAVNPQIAVAQAQSDISLVMGDLRRGQQVGPQLAAFVREEAALRERVEDTKIKMMQQILPPLIAVLALVEKGWPVIDFVAPLAARVLQDTVPGGQLVGVLQWIGNLIIAQGRDKNDLPTDDLLAGFPWGINPIRREGGAGGPQAP